MEIFSCTKENSLAVNDLEPSTQLCWGHATDSEAAPQILHSGGIRPAAIRDERDVPYYWRPAFYCRVAGHHSNTKVTPRNYVKMSADAVQHTRRHNT